jgi:hypothetical protein
VIPGPAGQADIAARAKAEAAARAKEADMIEYKVQALETGGAADIEKVCNDLAKDGWRLVSTAAANAGGTAVRVHMFVEREVAER